MQARCLCFTSTSSYRPFETSISHTVTPATLDCKSPADFCISLYRSDRCYEWDGVAATGDNNMCVCDGECRDMSKYTVVAVCKLLSCINGAELYSARYTNCFRGSSNLNVHAEKFMVTDEKLMSALRLSPPAIKKELVLYCTFQPCHTSGGGRKQLTHTTSCTRMLIRWSDEVLKRYNTTLTIVPTDIYRAHWVDASLFKTEEDASIYDWRTKCAREGIRLLIECNTITMRSAMPDDWDWLIGLIKPSSLRESIMSKEKLLRYSRDDHIGQLFSKD